MPGKVCRIVTGVNDAGRSYILSDTLLPTGAVAPGELLLLLRDAQRPAGADADDRDHQREDARAGEAKSTIFITSGP